MRCQRCLPLKLDLSNEDSLTIKSIRHLSPLELKEVHGLLSGEELDDAARSTGVDLPPQERSALQLLVYAALSYQYMRP